MTMAGYSDAEDFTIDIADPMPEAGARPWPHIMVVAGEPSGDALGAQLIAALRTLTGDRIKLSGVGGQGMAAQGLRSLFDIADTSVMGFTEVVPAIPRVLKRVRQTADYAMRMRPDVLVLIDSPDFTHRVAARVAARMPGLKVVKYVAPQVWASRPKRAYKLARLVDCVLTLLPFEPPWFERAGLRAVFVGHPVVERAGEMRGGAVFRTRHAIRPEAPVLLLLPGSRSHEVKLIMALFGATLSRLARQVPGLHVVVPAVPHLEGTIRGLAQEWDLHGLTVPVQIVGQNEKFAAFDAANAALAVSGTVSTELALAQVPMVICYRVGRVTEFLARMLVKVPFITLLNIIEGAGVIPEFVQNAASPRIMAEELEILLTEPASAALQVERQNRGLIRMGLGGDSPSQRAAQAVLHMLDEPPSPRKGRRGRAYAPPRSPVRGETARHPRRPIRARTREPFIAKR